MRTGKNQSFLFMYIQGSSCFFTNSKIFPFRTWGKYSEQMTNKTTWSDGPIWVELFRIKACPRYVCKCSLVKLSPIALICTRLIVFSSFKAPLLALHACSFVRNSRQSILTSGNVASNSTLRFSVSSKSSGKYNASERMVSIALTEISFLAMKRLSFTNITSLLRILECNDSIFALPKTGSLRIITHFLPLCKNMLC